MYIIVYKTNQKGVMKHYFGISQSSIIVIDNIIRLYVIFVKEITGWITDIKND